VELLFALNLLLHALHLLVIGANCFGWLWRAARVWVLALQLATLGSWVGFGILKGWWGYCPLTDWHWDVKRVMGETGLPRDYISYVLNNWFGLYPNPELLPLLIFGCFGLALGINCWLLLRKR